MGVATSWFFFKFHWFGSNDRQCNDTLRVLSHTTIERKIQSNSVCEILKSCSYPCITDNRWSMSVHS